MKHAKPLSPRTTRALAALLIVLHLAALAALAHTVPWTTDEPALLLAGRSLAQGSGWETTLHRTQGPLPLLAGQLFTAGMEGLGPDRTDPARFRARLGMLPFALLLLLVVWGWAREAWGEKGGLLALFLAAASPNLLGYGSLLAVDTAHTALTGLTLWLFWRWYKKPGPARLLAWAGALGLAVATKYLALLLALVLAGLLVARTFKAPSRARALARSLLNLGLAGAMGLFSLHAAYLFRAPLFDPSSSGPLHSSLIQTLASLPLSAQLLSLLPEPLVLGVDFQGVAAASYSGVFLDYQGGHWAYYLIALATKTPLATLLFLVLSLLAPAARPWPRFFLRVAALPALALLAMLSLGSALQPGLRYALPVYPLLLVIAGGWAARPWAATRPGRLLTALLCLWLGAGTLLAWPHYLGHFNEAVGGPAGGFRLFADSNCDWGQGYEAGLKTLKRRHPQLRVLGPFDGPRFGTLAAYALHLKPADPERPGRTHHWITRFSPRDRYGAAWLLFEVTPERFEAAARGEERAARELALAWIEAGDRVRARAALSMADPQAAAPLQRLLDLLALLEREPDDAAARREALGLMAGRGLTGPALGLLQEAGSGDRMELFFLLFLSGKPTQVISLLRARPGPLTPTEALLLASGCFQTGDLLGALNALERNSAPPPGDPLASLWDAFRQQLLELTESARKLGDPDQSSHEAQ